MNLRNVKIGVLGGIGPESTSYFYKKLIERFQDVFHPRANSSFPQIIINSIPAPEIIYSRKILNKEINAYKKGIIELNLHTPDFIVMACNTIHLFYDELQKLSKSKILDIRKVIFRKIEKFPNNKIFVLGTANTIRRNLYSIPEERCLRLANADILFIGKLIEDYNLGVAKGLQIAKFNKFLKKIISKKNVVVILACTELSLLNRVFEENIISSLDVMVEEVIDNIKRINAKNIS